MVKPHALSTAIAIAIASTTTNNVHGFQQSRPVTLSPSAKRNAPFAASTSSFRAAADINFNQHRQRNALAANGEASEPSSSQKQSLFGTTSRRTRRALQKIRRSFTVLLASLAFFLSTTRIHAPPAHAASAATAAATTSTLSLTQKLNPFRTRTTDEMIDAYVRDRLFADDEYDPVESAYREAFADAGGSGSAKDDTDASSMTGAYPTLLAETASQALGKQKSVSSVLSTRSLGASGAAGGASSSSVAGAAAGGKKDGITGLLIKSSDFLQSKLKVSASVSYYIIAGAGFVGVMTVPGLIGVLYQGIQRAQIDKSEMKMYGKISDMDATSKRADDDDDDDDEE